jgi:nitrite reductase (NADH) large subunit
LAALLALAALLLPSWPYSRSIEAGEGLDRFWLDDTWKQISGFTLLGLAAAIAFLSVRKRIKWRHLGYYRFWRIAHTVTGVAALCALFMHTGFNLGQNLNRWLMVTFLAVAIGGGLTGLVTAGDHTVKSMGMRSPRNALVWVHILTFWPMPVLLLLHVVTVYAY